MATKVKIEQIFEAGIATTTAPVLQPILVGPLNDTISRSTAGQYDTTDEVKTCFPFPDLPVNGKPNFNRYREVYGDPVFINAHFPHLTADGEENLERIQDNIATYRRFSENAEDRQELANSGGGFASNETFELFHPDVVEGSIVIARKHTVTITVPNDDGGGNPTDYTFLSTDFPLTNDSTGSVRADGIVEDTDVVTLSGAASVVRTKGLDYELEFDYDGTGTRWVFRRVKGGQIAQGEDVDITFQAKFPFRFGDGLDMVVDYENGTIKNNIDSARSLSLPTDNDIHDVTIYYGFRPVVDVSVFTQERASGAISQLPATDYTVKPVNGVDMVCVRPHVQGAIMEGDDFSVTDTLHYGNYTCGTKSQNFIIGGPCGNVTVSRKLHLCITNGAVTTGEFEIVLGGAPGIDNGDGTYTFTCANVVTQLEGNATFDKYLVAYCENGKLCIRLRDPSKGDTLVGGQVDMRGATNYFDILPGDQDVACLLGLSYGRVCGRTQYEITSTGSQFQTQQDSFGNLLGSVLIDVADTRYVIDTVVNEDIILVSQVDADGNLVCGTSQVLVPDGTGDWGIWYSLYSADILVSYTALRTDLGTEVIVIQNSDDVTTKLSRDGNGTNFSVGPDNPLAYAARKALINTQRDIWLLPVTSDDLDGYNDAIEVMELEPDIHLIVPLTYDEDVHSAIAAHVMDVSDPENVRDPMARMGVYQPLKTNGKVIGDSANNNEEVRFSANPAARAYTSSTIDPNDFDSTTGEAKVFWIEEGEGGTTNFVADGVQAGMLVRIHSGANAGIHRILSVRTDLGGTTSRILECTPLDSDTYFVFDTEHADCSATGTGIEPDQDGLISYTIYDSLTRSEFRDEIATISSPFTGLKYVYRSVSTWGVLADDQNSPDGRSVVVPGYFVNAALAGARGSAPVQQGMTNYPLQGFDDIYYSAGFFRDADLDTIEAAGVWIWQRPRRSTVVSSREQATVDAITPTNVLSGQFHIICIADRFQRRMWRALINYTGLYNIIEENIPIFRTAMTSVIRRAKATQYPRVGPEIVDGRIDSIACSKTNPRYLDVESTIWVPEELQGFNIKNFVRRSVLGLNAG